MLSRTAAFVGMSGALLAFFIAAGAPTPIFPLYEHDWGFTPATLTFAFGVYAIALIAALLVFGSLSDYVGRRPLLISSLAVELAAMVIFLVAPSVTWLIVGRILQGLATGVASATFGAAVVELAPERRKKLGAVMTSLATTAGLGLGALFAGVVSLAIPDAAALTVWTVLVVLMAVGTVLAVLTPETSTRRPGALASLLPRISVPASARRLFATTVPTIIATFLTTGLFLGLLPVILGTVSGEPDPIVSGGLNFVMFAVATAAAGFTSAVSPHVLRVAGGLALSLAAILLLGSLAADAMPLLWVAAVVAGAGSGSALSGGTRGLVPQVEPHERAGMFAAFFAVAYVTLAGAIIGGGLLVGLVGAAPAASGYAILLGIVALAAAALSSGRLARRRHAMAPATAPVAILPVAERV
ncbi:MFS transporter [Protaetiibacter mangrovi]|uniref:MFS transporter n=1 Tax=Protaetiibacter mangrovi TaxID=2970926 RepID=A0ABT1ZD04_9MICO|nr:MFS transporter [Protaetiibacter mangrovi]MCS0498578.1 MFS transporter [Protaetiibacter mangrovi]TPW92380.1 MFS transporter [Schumannella luteola]